MVKLYNYNTLLVTCVSFFYYYMSFLTNTSGRQQVGSAPETDSVCYQEHFALYTIMFRLIYMH